MSSGFTIARICEHCQVEFFAQKTTTRYCSHRCNSLGYKAKLRNQKIAKSNHQTQEIKERPLSLIKEKDFLSVRDACTLLGVSRWTIYKAIKANRLKAIKLGRRVIIKRSEIDKLF